MATAAAAFGAPPAPTDVVAIDRPFDAGKALRLQWKNADDSSRAGYLVFRTLLPAEIKQADRDSRAASATAAAGAGPMAPVLTSAKAMLGTARRNKVAPMGPSIRRCMRALPRADAAARLSLSISPSAMFQPPLVRR